MKRTIIFRIVAIILALSITMPLAGCGNVSTPTKPDETVPSMSQEPIVPAGDDDTSATDATRPSHEVELEETTVPTEETTEPTQSPVDIPAEGEELNETQKNSIAMLNYLAVLSQEINDSKNSRMFLEEAYASLLNNTNPEKVNELTQSYLCSMLDNIEKYRMISVKRDRLQYIYDQNKAKALKEAMPNPIGLLSAVNSFDLKRLAASAIYMAIDSYSSYQAYNTEIAQGFLQDGWALDDEEAENLHDSRKRAFMFMIEIVREDDLPGELALSESAVEEFVHWKNNSNNFQRIQFFDSEEATYRAFGNYWLTLVDCYYENGDYEKCLAAMDKYEELKTDVFRKDYYFSQTLPKAVVAASEVYGSDEYVPIAERYLDLLLENTESNEWSLRYFAAEVYLDLYAKTGNKAYIEKAYDIALNNVNNLVAEQRSMNETYLVGVREVAIPKEATKEEKKQIKEYNKSLKEQRKVELPPVYEPLALNCDLLFALAEELGINRTERERVESILRGNNGSLFLTKTLENRYSFNPTKQSLDAQDAQYDGDTLRLPVIIVSENSIVKVTVTINGESFVYDDWKIKEVKRDSDGVDKFSVIYTSKKAAKQTWSADAAVKIGIFMNDTADEADVVFNYTVSKYKNLWVVPDMVQFERVN